MLEGRTDAVSESIRGHLFTVADILEGLYGRTSDNHYGSTDTAPPDVAPPPTEMPSDDASGDGAKTIAVGKTSYPADEVVHPVASAAHKASLASFQEVARFIDSRVSEPFAKVKALHDYVTLHLTYDDATFEALEAGLDVYPSQAAADVFAARTAVCAGYAKLLAAMAAEVGVEIAYVVGRGGRDGWEVDGVSHAWNAAKIDDAWYLIDATWNDGSDI